MHWILVSVRVLFSRLTLGLSSDAHRPVALRSGDTAALRDLAIIPAPPIGAMGKHDSVEDIMMDGLRNLSDAVGAVMEGPRLGFEDDPRRSRCQAGAYAEVAILAREPQLTVLRRQRRSQLRRMKRVTVVHESK